MAAITAKDIAKLRKMTNCGLLDCKKALTETEGDFEKAVDVLRKAGIAKAGKKAGREANEGLVAVVVEGNKAALAQVSCETDFVSINDRFKDYTNSILAKAFSKDSNGDVTEEVNEEEKEDLITMIATIGENMKIVKALSWTSDNTLSCYLHSGGRIGVLVEVEGELEESVLKSIGMHIAAFSPVYVSADQIPAADLEREKSIYAEKAKGKPENIAEKIITGSVQKWYKDVCFNDQPWIMDDKSTFAQAFPNVTVKRFRRLQDRQVSYYVNGSHLQKNYPQAQRRSPALR